MQLIQIPYVKDLKYKGLHPIEKKKTLQKINLLIDKFNEFHSDLFIKSDSPLGKLTKKYGKSREIIRLLKKQNLAVYYSMCTPYIEQNKRDLYKKATEFEKNMIKDFKKFIKFLTTCGYKLIYINLNIEGSEFWKIYTTTNNGKSLTIKNPQYNDLVEEYIKTLEDEFEKCNINTISKIKIYLTDQEEKKLKEMLISLQQLTLGLENEIYKDTSLKKEMGGVIDAIKATIKIIKSGEDNLSDNKMRSLKRAFKGIPKFEEIMKINADTLKAKYFLPTMKSDKKTKKIILAIVAVLNNYATRYDLRAKITENIKKYVTENSPST